MEENQLAVQNELAIEDIKKLIYTIRGKQVMIDSDVANIYHCETKYVNRVVKRNIERFLGEFCFQLNENEFESLRCQFVTLNENGRGQHRKYLPYVFTEQGIAMLSALLKSDIAVSVSVNIMKAFIEMRKFLMINGQVFERLTSVENKLLEHDKNLDVKKFNKEYPILKVSKTNKFHDRFIVVDNKEMYHLGASIKDLGNKCFAINRIEDVEIIGKFINL